MPKVVPDTILQSEAREFVASCAGNMSEAARRIDIEKGTLWRFLNTGRALVGTRNAIREAISRNKSETDALRVSGLKRRSSNPAIANDDLKTIRAVCQGMIALVEMYESSLGGTN